MAKFKNIKKTKKQLVRKAPLQKPPKKEVSVKKEIKQDSKPKPKEALEFPKNSRSITEKLFKINFPKVSFNHRIWLHVINILALLGLLLVGIGLGRYIEQIEQLQTQKKTLQARLTKWEVLAQQYSGFRDLYLNIAILAYEVKDFKKSQTYVEKALDIDPNYLPALKLKGILLTTSK